MVEGALDRRLGHRPQERSVDAVAGRQPQSAGERDQGEVLGALLGVVTAARRPDHRVHADGLHRPLDPDQPVDEGVELRVGGLVVAVREDHHRQVRVVAVEALVGAVSMLAERGLDRAARLGVGGPDQRGLGERRFEPLGGRLVVEIGAGHEPLGVGALEAAGLLTPGHVGRDQAQVHVPGGVEELGREVGRRGHRPLAHDRGVGVVVHHHQHV